MRIRVIDIETTGFDPAEGGVCEIGWCDLVAGSDLAGKPYGWQVDTGDAVICNPGIDIPPQASAVHHLINDDTGFALPWQLWARRVLATYGDDVHELDAEPFSVLAAHSAKFEREWIGRLTDLPWICSYKAALRLWPDAPAHSNQCLRYWRRPVGLDRELATPAHRAFPDAYVTAFLLRDMLNDGATVEQLIEWTDQPALQVTCHIGKWRGTPWREVDDGFLYWVAERDFDEDVLFSVRHEIERRERERQEAARRNDPVGDSDEVPF